LIFPKKPQPVGAADSHGKPAVEDDQVGSTSSPVERAAEANIMKIDQIETHSVARLHANQQIAGVEISMEDARIVHVCDEFRQFARQGLAEHRLAWRPEGRQGTLDENI
jgi:hypothetical protein